MNTLERLVLVAYDHIRLNNDQCVLFIFVFYVSGKLRSAACVTLLWCLLLTFTGHGQRVWFRSSKEVQVSI